MTPHHIITPCIQGDSGGKVSLLGGDIIGYCEKKNSHGNASNSWTVTETECLNLASTLRRIQMQFSHELRRALRMTMAVSNVLWNVTYWSLTYLLTYILTCLLTYLLACFRAYLLTYLLACLLTYLLAYLLTFLLSYLLTYLLTSSAEQSLSW